MEKFKVPKAEEDNAQKTHSLNNFVTKKEFADNEVLRRTDDREDWEAMVADVCNIPGI